MGKRALRRTSLVAQVLSPPANAGDTGSIPGLGWSHMLQSNQRPRATATDLAL